MRHSPTLLAYLAGIIDADGTIGIKKSMYAMRVIKDSQGASYSERSTVRQVEPHAVDMFCKAFGGSRYLTKPSAPNGRTLHTWAVTDQKAAECLALLLPYLRIKKESAKNALRLRALKTQSKKNRVRCGRGHVGSSPRTQVMTEKMEALYQRAKELNRVGVRESRAATI